ncbi:uncharacterized protein LOC108138153 [Drosophila elegans]|uniref:uncharacterized protein LOC108138153 n=1 Tax=Drosophila elegans TaxID=30023 RepID=UPI0007E899C0|nr:uncharacterized protein LOC108138153 [Drosophila elegans]XP_041566268.1 uncharacterized protein LOC108138153 [Drosophila elegans]
MSFYLMRPSLRLMVVMLLVLALITDDVHAKGRSKSRKGKGGGLFNFGSWFKSPSKSAHSQSGAHTNHHESHPDYSSDRSGSSHSSYYYSGSHSRSSYRNRNNNTDEYQFNSATKTYYVPSVPFVLVLFSCIWLNN